MQKLNFWVPLQEPNGTPPSVHQFTYPPPPPSRAATHLYVLQAVDVLGTP